jgi:hypothetical protein
MPSNLVGFLQSFNKNVGGFASGKSYLLGA